MGTIKNEMEAADTSTFSLSSRKDLLTKIKKKNDKNNSNGRANKDLLSDLTSGSFLTNELRKSNDNDLVSSFTSLPLESYGFPYYRSYKNGGRSQDAVLVKDIGISCKLLNEKMLSHNFSKDTIVESYLIKRLKTEYNDLTEITKKISSYTNDIIRNLILRDRKKKEQIRSCGHKVLTEEETKEGYLKLRLKSDAEVRCLYRKDLFDSSNKRKNFKSTSRLLKDQKKIQERLFSNNATNLEIKNCSNSDNSSMVYDYLMMNNKRRMHRERELIDKETKRGFHRKFDVIQNGKETHESMNLTNWKEISRGKLRKNKSAPKMSRHAQISNEKLKRRNRKDYRLGLEEKFNDDSTITLVNGFLQDTNFHTVNIRILKHEQS
ncbi:uncharacterized protein V1477_004187 [Vespula maculifrons]|uniref:Uncharacterized protein n=1 Tax=Vespula maculifrons TaxID=7453 RepID=A0ABD2CQY0_VESMC